MGFPLLLAVCSLALLVLSTADGLAASLEHDAGAGANFAKAQFRFWCPDGLVKANGVLALVPGNNGDGRGMVSEAVWQKFAQDHSLALVACFFQDKPHEKNSFIEGYALASAGSGQALLDALTAFAKESKHEEVATAPLLLWGHSAGGQYNYEFACWKPERVLAFVVNKGGVYYTHLASDAARLVPGIFFIGENDIEFRVFSIYGIYAMNRRARALWTLAVEPKVGHGIGKTRELAIAFFEAVIPLRQPAPVPALVELKEDDGWVGHLKTFETRKGRMKDDEWSSWLPSESFSREWLVFVKSR